YVLCYFLISCVFGHLLSFPTRRSSDLGRLGESHEREVVDPGDEYPFVEGHVVVRVGAEESGGEERERGVVPGGLDDHVELRARADRKSTRLNSSHVSISYAVFCLKKKS